MKNEGKIAKKYAAGTYKWRANGTYFPLYVTLYPEVERSKWGKCFAGNTICDGSMLVKTRGNSLLEINHVQLLSPL